MINRDRDLRAADWFVYAYFSMLSLFWTKMERTFCLFGFAILATFFTDFAAFCKSKMTPKSERDLQTLRWTCSVRRNGQGVTPKLVDPLVEIWSTEDFPVGLNPLVPANMISEQSAQKSWKNRQKFVTLSCHPLPAEGGNSPPRWNFPPPKTLRGCLPRLSTSV